MKLSRYLMTFCCVLPIYSQARIIDNGGMEGGGGNSYNGKPLESYIGDITQSSAYLQKVAPLLATLKATEASTFNVITVGLRKSWFFIPGELQGLPSDKIGAAVPTDQVALQSFKEVWLNSNLFNRMTIDEQAKLILHEVLMGLRLLKYNSRYEQCMAYAFHFPATCEDRDRRSKNATDLTVADYADIRAAVREIWDTQLQDAISWDDVLARNNFSLPLWIFKHKSVRLELSGHELLNSLQTAAITNSFPRFGFSEELLERAEAERWDDVNSDGRCRFAIQTNVQAGNFTLSDPKKGGNYLFTIDKTTRLTRTAFWLNDRVVYGVSVSDKVLQSPGDTSNDIMFILDTYNKLLGFQTAKYINIDESNGSDRRYADTMITGSISYCSDQKSIAFQR